MSLANSLQHFNSFNNVFIVKLHYYSLFCLSGLPPVLWQCWLVVR